MFNDLSSLPTYLATRRSAKPRDMVAPGPDEATLENILRLAMRTPDHGKLFPWRFVTITDRLAFSALSKRAFIASQPDARPAQIDAAIASTYFAPTLVLLLYAPQHNQKVPDWEQQLSVGAVGMNLIHAAHAHGFVATWITGWTCYDQTIQAAICEGNERIAGLFYIGTPGQPLEERPRPDFETVVRSFP